MVTYTLFLYLNVITFCFQSSLCRSMKGLEPLCASTTTASVQSLTIHFHCGHVICKNCLQGFLDICIHCFHNRYPFLKINTRHFCHFLFFLLFMNGGQFYLPISMLLFTFTALAIIAATTARIITVVIIICFLSFFVEPPCEVSCFTLSLLQSHCFLVQR